MDTLPMSKRARSWSYPRVVSAPTDDELRRWAFDPDGPRGETVSGILRLQDGDLLIVSGAGGDRGRLFVELADSDAPTRTRVLRWLYLHAYDSVHGEPERTYLSHLVQRVCPWASKPDLLRWRERTEALIERSRAPDFGPREDVDYEDWAHGHLADK